MRSQPAPRTAAIALALALATMPFARADDAPPVEPRQGESHEAVDLSVTLTGVVQRVDAAGAADGKASTRATYRGDVTVTLPAGSWGDVEGKIFTHVRFGDGDGVALRPTYSSTPNTTAFGGAGSSDAHVIVAQAWYQSTATLPDGGSASGSHRRLEFTLGKMDAFAFFDQNAAADDETLRFLNNAFVHNPLLDSGGDTAADEDGFAPGVRFAYVDERDEANAWAVSLAAFGAGPGADFHGSLDGPFVIGQIETTRRVVAGLPGSYRAYAWTNGRTVDFGGGFQRHAGLGISIDQRIAEAITLWTRAGKELDGSVRFDRALTFGVQVDGSPWRRATDSIGLAAGFLRTSNAYRNATADGTLVGYAATGTERIVELYYRWHVDDHLELTPDAQWMQRPGGDATAPGVFVGGIRARVAF